ncbi:MAG: DUF5060 domain-containing protein [Anaerolineae bacterium]|nr:DUF5060 domain-containing protein [Anaerolineae bacterium]MDW8099987.1 DUF5060 domain-containing protein [Anaerolineae bacterium]
MKSLPYQFLSPPATVPRFDTIEWFLQAPPHCVANPFLDARLSGVIITPDGREIGITGFCDSEDGSLYRIRFMPGQEGDYRYRLHFQGTNKPVETQGVFRCVPSTRPGIVRVDPAHPYHFLREDGSRPFVLSKTAWLLAVAKNALDFIDQAAARGFNCLRFALETDYFFTEVGKDVWPWGGSRLVPDFTRFAVRFWQRVEVLVQHAAQHGVLMQPVIFCRLRREPPAPIPDPEMERYWDYLLARLAPFANILAWELFNEYAEDRSYQAYMACYLRAHDPYRHLICTSFGTTEDAAWPDADWLDLAINHSCTSSDPARHGLDAYYRRVALNIHRYRKPAWCNESGRERHHGNDDPVHRRKQAWVWNISGDYWSYHAWTGCEGIETGGWGPGEEYCQHMRPFWETHTRWWEMEPDVCGILARPPSDFAYLLRSEDEAVVYLVNELSGAVTQAGELTLALPVGEYELAFYYPADGRYRKMTGSWRTSAEGVLTLRTPAFIDDLVVHLQRVYKR